MKGQTLNGSTAAGAIPLGPERPGFPRFLGEPLGRSWDVTGNIKQE
jgi:hypothetical protein